MHRLCIYVTYDHENIVEDYVGYMLRELRKVVEHLVVVCNYPYIVRGMDHVWPFADEIFYRKNIGLDAGAYRDVLCRFLGWDVVCRYDELLLVNDSFYGPVYPFEDLFDRMEKMNVDYWGMTRCPAGKLFNGYKYGVHIQSYFLALRNNVLMDDRFRAFWENMTQPQSLIQAVIEFEFGINRFLQEADYQGLAAMELCSSPIHVKESENPYMICAMELIRDAGIPVLKRRSLALENTGFGNALKALEFIDRECDYKTDMIIRHLARLDQGLGVMSLDGFYVVHSRIYIYGAGTYGKKVAMYFAFRGWSFEKFLVTDREDIQENCISFDDACIAENDGIIIAVGSEKIFREILNIVEKRCLKKQIFNIQGIIR